MSVPTPADNTHEGLAPWDLLDGEILVMGEAPVVTSASILRDPGLSMKAKGIYSTILAMSAWGERITAKGLAGHAKDGREAIWSGLRELRAAGWVEMFHWAPPRETGIPRVKVYKVHREAQWTADPLCVFPGQSATRVFRATGNPCT